MHIEFPDSETEFEKDTSIPVTVQYVFRARQWKAPLFTGRLYYFIDNEIVSSDEFGVENYNSFMVGKGQEGQRKFKYTVSGLKPGKYQFKAVVLRADFDDKTNTILSYYSAAKSYASSISNNVDSMEYYNALKGHDKMKMGDTEYQYFRVVEEKADVPDSSGPVTEQTQTRWESFLENVNNFFARFGIKIT